MRVKCDDCPCFYMAGRDEDEERCVFGARIDWGGRVLEGFPLVANYHTYSDNCPLLFVQYMKDGEPTQFTPPKYVGDSAKTVERYE